MFSRLPRYARKLSHSLSESLKIAYFKQYNIVGSTTGSRAEAREMFEFTQKGLVHPVIEKGSLKDVEKYIDMMLEKKILGKVVLNVDL